ncbi:hypothetical protein pEaSNUABM50_00495 [Erwinia phage pEa_SNUABM_50]|uniref:Uncharacterized protein n=3 Tax=Eneladusvirus BF TaxID=2560751 RepID=A0A7L8ZR00_9CAUD|nr:putative membrane protein [Erwinia phage pEa_SNUABM_12]QOI71951.1 putative membrane protein [Erwinia phage pEa_SNUABM_47]QOI72491.1 hypothetical protein pEaSNUABM50_00495 [Erwinia phage pEa_SNUABM_50]QXO11619.1 hypothetical protein pEaSNUABM19_00502 [Erwinia phage pEa_SNUABM_19]QXO12167.1 hypothetical protein pEaSNUABM44_00500 [Erwinia phage pEa_SNUABM_44]QXO12723.1 hypothetical protein pEaSNUABM49_00504 [Erwinia phage pEa_SNUABM_49]
MSLTTLVFLMFGAACITLIANKMIAATIYNRSTGNFGKKSPYGLSREQGVDKKWGYCITKHGKILRGNDGYGSAPVYLSIAEAVKDMNVMEAIEGYKLTTINLEENT